MRVGSKSFWAHALFGGALIASSGCAPEDVPLGNESSAINLDRCYGEKTRCSRATSTTAPEVAVKACDEEASGTLEDDFWISTESGKKLVIAPDDTIWILGSVYIDQGDGQRLWIAHYTADGELIGRNDSAKQIDTGNAAESDLVVDENGDAYVVASWRANDDPDDKDRFTEHTTLQRFGNHADALGAWIHLTGSAGAQLVAGPGADLTLAGDAPYNGHSGVVTRLHPDGSPLWIQNDVPSVGAGVGWGVSGLVVDAEGEATVVSERHRDYDANESTYGLSHYDAEGNELWSWTLPAPFEGGTRADLALGAYGNYIVAGEPVRSQRLIQSFSADAQKRWAYEVLSIDPGLTVDAESGDTIISADRSIVVIDKDGTACKRYARPIDGSLGGYTSLASHGGQVYFLTQTKFGRFKALSAE